MLLYMSLAYKSLGKFSEFNSPCKKELCTFFSPKHRKHESLIVVVENKIDA